MMITPVWHWFLNLFRAAADLVYEFRCVVCALVELLTMATARQKGWTNPRKRDWICPACSGKR